MNVKNDFVATTLKSLAENSPTFLKLKKELTVAVKLSCTGITNLVVNHEDPDLVDFFLNSCYEQKELWYGTNKIDAVELQQDAPGASVASSKIDQLIFGTFKMIKGKDGREEVEKDLKTGKRKRNVDGFVSRKVVSEQGDYDDKTLIIRNLDFAKDFCSREPATVNSAIWVFDNFRQASVRHKCKILIVSNEPIKLPFNVTTICMDRVDVYSANYIIDSFVTLYKRGKYEIEFTETQKQQINRKLQGITYTEASDILIYALTHSINVKNGVKQINSKEVMKNVRNKVNELFMKEGVGLTHLNPKPWEDYICPEHSSFTFDVKKMLRDIKEVDSLAKERDDLDEKDQNSHEVSKNLEAIQMRMPHVIVLYGKGGVGKSAFPIHLAGLLEFDVWDFNVNASHSKWVGEGSENMREALKKINKASHLIVRIDEYDRAMGSTGESGQGMHEAHKQVESEFMNWLQNSQEENLFVKQNIFVVMTTNHKENITGPMLRSGRADLVIDIDNFDTKSMKQAFMTAPRRMKNRGFAVTGFVAPNSLDEAIAKLDVDKLSELAMVKGFTVRDVDVLLSEMSAHNYYYEKYKGSEGINWNTENFMKVLNKSQGSIRDTTTGELVLGDRYINDKDDEEITQPFNKNSIKDKSKVPERDEKEVFDIN